MAKINLTNKPQSEQVRIMKDYLDRRGQHKQQELTTVEHLIKRFRHNRCFTNKAKAAFLSKLFKIAQSEYNKTEILDIK